MKPKVQVLAKMWELLAEIEKGETGQIKGYTMKAVLKTVEFMGKVGVGVYINHGLSTVVFTAVNLLDTIEALKTIGYEVQIDNDYDESELEDESLINDWEA